MRSSLPLGQLRAFQRGWDTALESLLLETEAGRESALGALRDCQRMAAWLGLAPIKTLAGRAGSLLGSRADDAAIALVYEACSILQTAIAEQLSACETPGAQLPEAGPCLAMGQAIGAIAPPSVPEAKRPREALAQAAGPGAPPDESTQTIRVSKDKLDRLLGMIGRLVVTKNTFMHLTERLHRVYKLPAVAREVQDAALAFAEISDELKQTIREVRMQRVEVLFHRFPRLIRDLAHQCGKEVELHLSGEAIEIDRTILEKLGDPLMHLVRNAVDHGLEPPEERLAALKEAKGRLSIEARIQGAAVHLTIRDDGRGMDPAGLKAKAIEKGLITAEEAEAMSHEEALGLIFAAGFSMAKQVTDISGRGVGMDVVRSNIRSLGGDIRLASTPGAGTAITLQVPQETSLDILEGLLLSVGAQTFALEVAHIRGILKLDPARVHGRAGSEFIHHQGSILPLVRLDERFGLEAAPGTELSILVTSTPAGPYGLIVDAVLKPQEIVLNPLRGPLAELPGIKGATILGDGRVLLILDPQGLIRQLEPA